MQKITGTAVVFLLIALLPNVSGAEDLISAPYSPKEGDRWEFTADIKDPISNSSDNLMGHYAAEYKKGQLVFFRVLDGIEYETGVQSTDQLKRLFGFVQDQRQYFRFPLRPGDKREVEQIRDQSRNGIVSN